MTPEPPRIPNDTVRDRLGREVRISPAGSFSRSEHHQDRVTDRWWQRWPGLDQLAQTGVDFHCFLTVVMRYLLRLDDRAVGRVGVTGLMMAGQRRFRGRWHTD